MQRHFYLHLSIPHSLSSPLLCVMDGNLLWQRFNIYFAKAMQYEILCENQWTMCEGGTLWCVAMRLTQGRERKFIEKCKCGFCWNFKFFVMPDLERFFSSSFVTCRSRLKEGEKRRDFQFPLNISFIKCQKFMIYSRVSWHTWLCSRVHK